MRSLAAPFKAVPRILAQFVSQWAGVEVRSGFSLLAEALALPSEARPHWAGRAVAAR